MAIFFPRRHRLALTTISPLPLPRFAVAVAVAAAFAVAVAVVLPLLVLRRHPDPELVEGEGSRTSLIHPNHLDLSNHPIPPSLLLPVPAFRGAGKNSRLYGRERSNPSAFSRIPQRAPKNPVKPINQLILCKQTTSTLPISSSPSVTLDTESKKSPGKGRGFSINTRNFNQETNLAITLLLARL